VTATHTPLRVPAFRVVADRLVGARATTRLSSLRQMGVSGLSRAGVKGNALSRLLLSARHDVAER
jgi:hypothetical protein